MDVNARPIPIAIIVPPQAQLLDVSGLVDAFLEANCQSDGAGRYELLLISASSDRLVSAGGISIITDFSIFDEDREIDTLLIAGTRNFELAHESADLRAWLRRRVPSTRRYASVGTGAFFLGAAGLLDGMTATTHWDHTAELARTYPAARILPNRTYVEDGALYSSAGVTAGLDLALRLIEKDLGRDLARKVACRLVSFLNSSGRMSQFSADLLVKNSSEDHIDAVKRWIMDHLSLDLTLKVLAGRAGMSKRHFVRIFQRETGVTPSEFVEMARVKEAIRLIETSNLLLKDVASSCGFSNQSIMSRTFMRRNGAKPSHYLARPKRNSLSQAQ